MKILRWAAVCAALFVSLPDAVAQPDPNPPMPAPVSPKPGGWSPKNTDDPDGVYQRTARSSTADRKAMIAYGLLGVGAIGFAVAYFIRDTRSALARRQRNPWDV